MKDNKKDKSYIIIVNSREKEWDQKKISYIAVVILAYGEYSEDENIVYTVTYSKGPESHHEGSMVKDGKDVRVKDGMIFNVTQTNKS